MQVQANEIVLGSCSGRQNRPRCAAWASKIGANVPRKIWAKGGFEAVIRIWRDRQDFKFEYRCPGERENDHNTEIGSLSTNRGWDQGGALWAASPCGNSYKLSMVEARSVTNNLDLIWNTDWNNLNHKFLAHTIPCIRTSIFFWNLINRRKLVISLDNSTSLKLPPTTIAIRWREIRKTAFITAF